MNPPCLFLWYAAGMSTWANVLMYWGFRVVGALIIIGVAFLIGMWIKSLFNKAAQRTRLDPTLARFFGTASMAAILVLAIITALGLIGVPTASFAAVIAATGFAIGFAMKDTLGDLAAGVLLLINRPFKVGDYVRAADETGIVDEIALFYTRLDTLDHRRLVIPNGKVFGDVIENYSFHDTRRVDIDVGVSYDADIDRTRDVLNDAINRIEQRLKEPEPAVVLMNFGDSSVNWQVRVWVPRPEFLDAKQALTRAVKQALDEAGISIPFPQRDVRLFQESTQ